MLLGCCAGMGDMLRIMATSSRANEGAASGILDGEGDSEEEEEEEEEEEAEEHDDEGAEDEEVEQEDSDEDVLGVADEQPGPAASKGANGPAPTPAVNEVCLRGCASILFAVPILTWNGVASIPTALAKGTCSSFQSGIAARVGAAG